MIKPEALTPDRLGSLCSAITDNPDRFRVLRRIHLNQATLGPKLDASMAGTVQEGTPLIILMLKATGNDVSGDTPVEIGMLKCYATRNADGNCAMSVAAGYQGVEFPGGALSDEQQGALGLTNEALQGQAFDDAHIAALMHDDPIVISHNALTSRRFFDTRFPAHARLRWGCSARDLDWHKRYGYQGKILETLCMQTGAFYESGRSINEAAALAWLLNRHSCMVSQLLARADQDETLVDAFGLPLEQKATVRQAGFEWVADGRGKRLHKRVPFDQAESLQQWLTGLGAVPGLVTLDCRSRFAAM